MKSWSARSAAAAALLSWALSSTALAHQASMTYARVEAPAEAREVLYELRIHSRDLYEALELDRDREATSREILDGEERLFAYVASRIDFEVSGQSCRIDRRGVDVVKKNERYARLTFAVVCPRPIVELAINYDLFFDLDPRHTSLVAIDGDVVELSHDENRLVWNLAEPPPSGIAAFVRSGIDHIVFGPDHILFLLSLLFMAVVRRSERGFEPRPLREAMAYTAVIVTSFTVAHSLTLIGAALGWFELPSRLVESVIAASIIYVAVENAVRPDPPRRYLVTFFFGLIHGLGFASMLRPLLPPEDVVLPLLAFNVGVELGQLALVLVALPPLYALARALGGDRYRKWVLPGAGAALALIGLLWLFQRALALRIPGL